jgi:hypothetical protein
MELDMWYYAFVEEGFAMARETQAAPGESKIFSTVPRPAM